MKKNYLITPLIFCALLFGLVGISHAASKTWTNGSGDHIWGTAGNWSPSGAPGTTDDVIFSASSTQNCNINGYFVVNSITITSGYTGTITQNSGSGGMTASNGFSQAGGTFTGSSGGDQITVGGDLLISSGTFKSTSGQLVLDASSTITGVFQNNSGTVLFVPTTNTATITGSSTFYNLQFSYGYSNNTFTIATGTVLTATGYLNFLAIGSAWVRLLGGGAIDAQGNIEASNSVYFTNITGTASIVVNGAGAQTLGDNSVNGAGTPGLALPNLTIAKPSGSLTLANTIFDSGNWTNTSGTAITPGTSTMVFSAPQSALITGSSTFGNLVFAPFYSAPAATTFTIATGTILTTGGLGLYGDQNVINTGSYLPGYFNVFLNGGEIDTHGNISWGSFPGGVEGGTTSIVVNGTSTQSILGMPTIGSMMPDLTINKTAGTLNLNGVIIMAGSWNHIAGTINPGTSTIDFHVASGTITGSSTFYNLFIMNPKSPVNIVTSTVTIGAGTVLTVSNQLGILGDSSGNIEFGASESTIILNGGEIEVQGTNGGVYADGAISFGNEESTSSGGTTSIVMDGTSTQEIFTDGDRNILPSLTVNTPPGVAVYATNEYNLDIVGPVAVNSGEFQIASDTPATSGSDNITFGSSVTVAAGAVLSDYDQVPGTVQVSSTIVNNGTIFFDGSAGGCVNPLPNDVILENIPYSGTHGVWSGTGSFIMRYVNVSYQSSTVPITVYNGTNSGNNTGSWSFATSPRTQLIQGVSSSSGSGASQLALPAFGFWPRVGDLVLVAVSARNQSINAPTDSASNTYMLVASSTFGSSPSYALSLYYAKNINTSSSFAVTANGTGGGGSFLSASAFEYTDIAPSTTLDAYSSYGFSPPATSTALTSLSATGHSLNELYFGAATISASTTAAAGSGWTSELGITNNTTNQSLYTEDMATTSITSASANWTAATGTSYAAIMGIFRSPYVLGYDASGTLDSATFDTGAASGAQLNSVVWQGAQPAGTSVKFQFAVSNASSGPWNFVGPDGTANTTFPYSGSSNPGTTINLYSTSNGYGLFSGYRYFRYRVMLFADNTNTYSPTVTGVSVNWSP